MRRLLCCLALLSCPLVGQQYKLAIVGLNHDHVWPQLGGIMKGDLVTLVGVAETLPDRVARAEKEEAAQGGTRPAVSPSLVFTDWKKMIDATKPDIVWAFLETSRHLEVVQYCAPRGINVTFEYPLAVTYRDALEIQALARRYNTLVLTNNLGVWTAPIYVAKSSRGCGHDWSGLSAQWSAGARRSRRLSTIHVSDLVDGP